MSLEGGEHRMGGCQLAELATEGRLLLGSQVLITEEDDEVVCEAPR